MICGKLMVLFLLALPALIDAAPGKSIMYLERYMYIYRVLQTIQMKLILLCVWAERTNLGSAKTTLKIKYEI